MSESYQETLDYQLSSMESEAINLYAQLQECHDTLRAYQDSRSVIFDVEDFKHRLSLDGLLSDRLNDAIDIYLKHYNVNRIEGD